MAMKPKKLPVVSNCDGCGVCCLHMGYPAFILPRDPELNIDELASDETRRLLASGWTRDELQAGIKGEINWHRLPEELRAEWYSYVEAYRAKNDLDGPCYWFDPTTRQCKHHEYRPQVCRDFETGSQACHEWRNHYRSMLPS